MNYPAAGPRGIIKLILIIISLNPRATAGRPYVLTEGGNPETELRGIFLSNFRALYGRGMHHPTGDRRSPLHLVRGR